MFAGAETGNVAFSGKGGDHGPLTAIITQLAQGFFESIGNSLLRSVRGRGLVPSEPATSRGPGLRFGLQLRLLHRPARLQDRPRQLGSVIGSISGSAAEGDEDRMKATFAGPPRRLDAPT